MKTPSSSKPTFITSLFNAARGIGRSLPIILTVILLMALIKTYLPPKIIVGFLGGSGPVDTLAGAGFGSILAGNSINSYIIGRQLLDNGAHLAAVTAFLAAWVIVGIVQLPAEAVELGKRFAILRTIAGFLFCLAMAWVIALNFSGSLG